MLNENEWYLRVDGSLREDVTDIELNQSVQGDIGYNGNLTDTYRIDLLNGDFSASVIFGGSAPKVRLAIYDTNGKRVAYANLKPSGVAFTPDKLLTAGTYYVQVQSLDGGKTKGDYTLMMNGVEFPKANQQRDDEPLSAPLIEVNRDQTLLSNVSLASDEWVGFGDTRDYRRVELDAAGRFNFKLTDLTGKVTLSIYTLTDKGTLKKYKSISVSATSKKNGLSDLLLQAGTYYVCVEAPNAKKGYNSDYDLTLSGEMFTQGNNADDNWQNLGDEYHLTVNATQGAVGQTLIKNDWVGFGDAKDYRKLSIESAGVYTFRLANISYKAKFTIYRLDSNGKLKPYKSLAVGAGNKELRNLKLEAGTYYISVESLTYKSGKNTYYDLEIFGEQFTQGNNADDNWQNLGEEFQLTVSGESNPVALELIKNDWVGFGDLKDFRKVTFESSGSYTFRLCNISAPTKLTIYRVDSSGRLKAVKSMTVSSGTKDLKNLKLEGGTYYLGIESLKGNSAKNSYYDLQLFGELFPQGNTHNNTFTTATQIDLTGNIEKQWVGFGNSKDYYTFVGEGEVDFTITGTKGAATMTLYQMQPNGKVKALKKVKIGTNGFATISGFDLSYGGYFLEVASADNGKGGKNTYYDVIIDAPGSAAVYDLSPAMTELAVNSITAPAAMTEWSQNSDPLRFKGMLA